MLQVLQDTAFRRQHASKSIPSRSRGARRNQPDAPMLRGLWYYLARVESIPLDEI